MKIAFVSLVFLVLFQSAAVAENCTRFHGSTMSVDGVKAASWRQDYPKEFPDPRDRQPWEELRASADPEEYMQTVIGSARPFFKRVDGRLTGSGSEPWWISEWLDYGSSGREPLMGLTKERGPKAGDLSAISREGPQIWAVGFYNTPGSAVLGEVFSDSCNPFFPVGVSFPVDTVSVKFLFTDAPSEETPYLEGAPLYYAHIDAPGSGSTFHPVAERVRQPMRLLQVDVAVKDPRSAPETGWIFGTFVWKGPAKGDGLFDNLVPVALQWGNDPGIYDEGSIKQSWVNDELRGVVFGWESRPTLGFMGRANGPADNIRSSCLSCHSAARSPRSTIGILNNGFDMKSLGDAASVKRHVDIWFQNIRSGQLFQPVEPAASSLDYSLQLEAAAFRVCSACEAGDLEGGTPPICRSAGFYNRPTCGEAKASPSRKRAIQMMAPPRQ